MHVVDDIAARPAFADASMAGFAPAEMQEDMNRAATKSLEAVVGDDDRRELQATTVLRASNNTAKEIVDYAKEASIDIVVIGATGRGAVDRLLMGSVADKVIRRAPCPVLAVRRPEHEFVIPDALQAVASRKG
jgi:nucleotide-binding universal stress UspA family protein